MFSKQSESLLLNDQMNKVYKALVPIGLGGLGLGALTRAFTGVRDGSFAFGNTNNNLKLLASNDPYLSSVRDVITLPRNSDGVKSVALNAKTRKEVDKEEERNKEGEFINFSNLASPVKTFFRGSANPTGNESFLDIPAALPLGFFAGVTSMGIGGKLMDSRIKNTAKNKLKQEQEKVKREFEAALIYEQEEAARRNKKASEECELVQAVDVLYSAMSRFECLEKTAGIEMLGITGVGLLSLLAAHKGYHKQYKTTKEDIERKEKEKMLGLNTNYDDILKNLASKNLAQLPNAGVSMHKTPAIGASLIKDAALKKKNALKRNVSGFLT